MSWDKGTDQQVSPYTGRPSNSLARLAFNIYGTSGGTTPSGISRTPSYHNRQSSPPNATPPKGVSPVYDVGANDITTVRYKSNSELIGLCKLNTDSDHVVMAGKTTLQIYRVGTTVVPIDELLTNSFYMKNKKAFGTILDVKCGHRNYNKYVAASTTTGSILIFNTTAKSNKLLFKYSDQTRAINTLSFSQLDPHLLLSGSQDGAVKLWDLRASKGKPTLTIQPGSDAVRSIQFSPFHNKKFAAISDSGVILKWDLRLPTQFEKKLNAHTGPGLCIEWHPEFDYLVSAGRDKQVQIWNMNSDTRVPEHVIYSANPVSKVTWRPTVSNSITGAEVAMSFLNNDMAVQIYSLKRKYIPLYTIESHTAQITGLSFKDERFLMTCSKDKFFCKEDLALYPHTIDNLSLTSVSWTPNNDIIFIDQQKKKFETDRESDTQQSGVSYPQPSTSPSSNPSALTSTPYMSYNTSPRPGMSRSSSVRPSLIRGQSGNLNIHHTAPVMNPTAIPVTLPIMKNKDALKYLAENYVIDPSEDLVASCVKNAATASEVGNYRDAQTWNVIKESLLWERQLDQELIYDVPEVVHGDGESLHSDLTSEKYQYSTSASTNYGKSPSLSDLSEFNSLNSKEHHFATREHRLSIIKSIKSKSSITDIQESESEDPDHGKTVTREDVLRWADTLKTKPSDTAASGDDTLNKDENEVAVEFTEATTKPVALHHRKRSIRESMLDIADSNSAQSRSPTYSLMSSMSAASIKPLSAPLAPILSKQSLSKQNSHMSELTKQLTGQNTDHEKVTVGGRLLPPFVPRQMIRKSVEFSSGQGDLIMSCTLLLLFNDRYKILPEVMMKNSLFEYLQFLQRMTFWVPLANILQITEYDEFKQMSSNSTTVRRFCSKCGVLVVNEKTKEKYLKDDQVNFGAWFCEQCGCRSKCIYCNEPLKGLNIFRLKCGHNGHFGCFKSWMFDEGMSCCPGGC